jgi:hypothetical protein
VGSSTGVSRTFKHIEQVQATKRLGGPALQESRLPISLRLGTISVDLVANTVSFSDSMSKMSQLSLSTSRNVQRSLTLISTAATAMAASITASLAETIVHAEDFAFSIQKAALATGTTNEMMSKLAYNAKLVGVPLDQVKMAMERMARTSGAAQSGQKEAIKAYAALGISVKDLAGPLKDSGDLTVAVAKKIDGFKDSTNKTTLEQKLFGRSGAELAPLLKQLATGFGDASKQATLFGVVIGNDTAAQALKLHQSMTELESVGMGVSLRLLNDVAPALEKVADKVLAFATSAEGMKKIDRLADDLGKAVTLCGDAFQFLADHSTAAKRALEGIAALQVGSVLLPLISTSASAAKGVDSIGLATLKMVSRMSGVSAVVPILKKVSDAIQLQTWMVTSLAREEGLATAGAYALSNAWRTATASMLTNPVGLAIGAVALLTYGMYEYLKSVKDSEKEGGTWGDEWHAAIMAVKEDLNDAKKVLDLFTGDFADFSARKWQNTPFEKLTQNAGDQRRANGPIENPFKDYWINNSNDPTPKNNAPALPKDAPDKVDHLKLKMDELVASAKDAKDALANAGKSIDFERAAAIAKEYDKTIIELTATLKAQHKVLTDADKAAIKLSITTRVNDESQAKFRDELAKGTSTLLAQASAQDILTQAIGQGSDAVRTAAIKANAAKRDADKSPEWKALNPGMIADMDSAFAKQYDASNKGGSTTALAGVQAQINAQLMLNGAIMQGKRAREEAALAVEQDAIRRQHADKGDTNQSALDAELASNEKLFRLKQAEANLSRGASMNPFAVYREQADALEDAANAARAAGAAISDMEMQAAKKANLDAYFASVEKTVLAVGSASQGVSVFFNEMARGTQSAAQQVHELLGGAFEDLNSTIVKMVTTQTKTWADFVRDVRNDFSGMFREVAGSLAKLGLQKVEQGIAGSLLDKIGGKTANPTVSAIGVTNALLKSILSAVTTNGGIGSTSGGAVSTGADALPAGGDADGSSGSNVGSGIGGILGSLFGGIFGGHLALGGPVTAGVTYDVGDMGRERFTPSTNGTITRNSDLGGSGAVYNVQVANGVTPEQMAMHVRQALQEFHPVVVRSSLSAMRENTQRMPQSKR